MCNTDQKYWSYLDHQCPKHYCQTTFHFISSPTPNIHRLVKSRPAQFWRHLPARHRHEAVHLCFWWNAGSSERDQIVRVVTSDTETEVDPASNSQTHHHHHHHQHASTISSALWLKHQSVVSALLSDNYQQINSLNFNFENENKPNE